ncbi:hypothetical protein TcCL_ESM04260 [Trypanosoma cruzi]|nr:hypothetical protein TcCL_ESM04260 [Trypanosoma cruzi]
MLSHQCAQWVSGQLPIWGFGFPLATLVKELVIERPQPRREQSWAKEMGLNGTQEWEEHKVSKHRCLSGKRGEDLCWCFNGLLTRATEAFFFFELGGARWEFFFLHVLFYLFWELFPQLERSCY